MLDQSRVSRFLYLATCVVRLRVYNNPQKWINWARLDRLLPLVQEAGDGRLGLLPWVTHCTFQVGPQTRRLILAPLVKLVASPTLKHLWVQPSSPNQHAYCTIEDASEVFGALSAAFLPRSRLEWLSIFPETTTSTPGLRPALVDRFVPLTHHLEYCSISAWLLSEATIIALAQAPLRWLEAHGRFAVDSGDLSRIQFQDMPQGAFAQLATLVVNDVPLELAYHLLSTRSIIDHVRSLRIEIAPVDDLDNDEDVLYTNLLHWVAAAPYLDNFCFIAGRGEAETPYPISPALLLPLLAKNLVALRLYRFSLAGTVGFSLFHDPGNHAWTSLRRIAIMHQDLVPEDFVQLSHLPSLGELSGNVSIPLGRRRDAALAGGFRKQLILSSQFRFSRRYQGTPADAQVLTHIVW
jgi:hypothetical protein